MRKVIGAVCLVAAGMMAAACGGSDASEEVSTTSEPLCSSAPDRTHWIAAIEAWEQPRDPASTETRPPCGQIDLLGVPKGFDVTRQKAYQQGSKVCYWKTSGTCSPFQRQIMLFRNAVQCYGFPAGEFEMDVQAGFGYLPKLTVYLPTCTSTYLVDWAYNE